MHWLHLQESSSWWMQSLWHMQGVYKHDSSYLILFEYSRSIVWEYVLHPHYLYTTCSITCFPSLSFVQLYITKLNDNDCNVCHKWYLHNCFTKWQNRKCSYIILFESHYPLQLWMYCCNALPQYLPLLCSLWHKVFNRNKPTCETLLNNLSLYVRAVKVTM